MSTFKASLMQLFYKADVVEFQGQIVTEEVAHFMSDAKSLFPNRVEIPMTYKLGGRRTYHVFHEQTVIVDEYGTCCALNTEGDHTQISFFGTHPITQAELV